MSFPVPTGMSLQSLEKDTATLTIDATHSVGQPHVVVIDRKAPSFSGGGFSQPRYRIRVIRGNKDSENLPIQARTLADLELQWVVGNVSGTIEDDIIDPLKAILNTANFAALVFDQQSLPN